MSRTRIFAILSAAAVLVIAGWFLTRNIVVDELNIDGVPAECGSAYDAALFRAEGFSGGEVTDNQDAIDASCVRESARSVAVGSALAGLAVGVGGSLVLWPRSRASALPARRTGERNGGTGPS